MLRVLPIAGLVVASLGLAGCAGTWDTLTSRKFRKAPFETTYRMVVPEDAAVVLRADPPRPGDERAAAMRRLQEPLANKGTQQDQDWAVDLLARTAAADPSPVLRIAAIDALGRFQDPRAVGALTAAYQNAHGRPGGAPEPAPSPIQLAGAKGRTPAVANDIPFSGPTGFPPDTVAAVRCAAAEALGRTGQPEAATYLAAVAVGPNTDAPAPGAEDPQIRLAAVRGLGRCRQPEAVVALARVLAAESGKRDADDVVRVSHDGLVRLTGKKLPPDPRQWEGVVQAGVVIAPEPTWVDDTVQQAVRWATRP